MPRAMATRTSRLVSCCPSWTVEEGDIASFFVMDLGLALAPKMCLDQSQAFNEVNNRQAFTVRKNYPLFFLDEPLPGAPRHVFTTYHANVQITDCRTNTKSNLTPKIEYTLKPSTYDAKPWFLHFNRKKVQMSTPFFERDPDFLHI